MKVVLEGKLDSYREIFRGKSKNSKSFGKIKKFILRKKNK